ncbi:MAG TPA: alpha/beta hydrolase [Vicinamibacterales bacterium]|nr:alpha/beta hydrolase [Vicinamibacterales bacterium]
MTALAAVIVAFGPAMAAAQPSAPIVTKTDVIYGRVEGSALLANVAYPDGPSLKPAIISVHGGRWRAGNRADASSIKVQQWAEFGFFAMSIDYRLVGGSPAPAPQLDLLCAIRWLHAHAEEYRIDPERVYLIGQSAGGQMVSLVATAGEAGFPRVGGWEKARSDVRAVISVAATYELTTLSWGNLWTPVAGNVDEARRHASPINHVTASTKPILIIHSDDDKSVPVQQATEMAAKLQASGVRHRYVHYTDRGHMGITDDVIKEARAFIAELEQKK